MPRPPRRPTVEPAYPNSRSVATQSSDERDPLDALPPACLACGALIERGLTFVGSLRCVECRDNAAPLQPSLVDLWHTVGAPF
jgi:hypothetical protein